MTAPIHRDRRKIGRCDRPRRGAILVMVALLLPVFLLIIGFSVDLARMQSVRTEMRAVADLSAKAAAGELSRTQNVMKARAAARDVAGSNLISGAAVSLDDQDIVFGRSERQSDGSWAFQPGGSPLNSIEVNVRRTSGGPNGAVGMVFGKLYGRATMEHEVAATASFLDVDICLVLDRSSSMKLSTSDTTGHMSASNPRFCATPNADSRWVALENAVSLFISHLQTTLASEHVALVTFASNYTSPCGETSTEASVDQDLIADLPLINQAMSIRSNAVWNGNTNIDAGMRLARNVLNGPRSRDNATKVMVVLTDGVYTGSNPITEATQAAGAGIIVHTITFGSGANQTDMQAVAYAADGEHFHAPDATALNDVFTRISGAIAILTH